MHLELEDFQQLLSGQIEEATRLTWVEHLIDCPTCTRHFRALRDLDRHIQPKAQKHPLRWAIGVAAVCTMAAWPYFQKPNRELLASEIQMSAENETKPLGILEKVEDQNYRSAVLQWGQGKTVLEVLQAKKDKG